MSQPPFLIGQDHGQIVLSTPPPPPTHQLSESESNSVQWVRHPDPRFWRQSRIVVFGVDKTLFRVDLEALTAHSDPLNQIFNIPPSTEFSEGTETNPIIIEGISAEEFSQFVLWVYHVEFEPLVPSEGLYLGIFKVCDIYQIHNGLRFAIDGLTKLSLPSSRMIQLGIEYALPDFIKPAVSKLVDLPLRDFTPTDLDRLGLTVYHIITRTKEALIKEACLLSALPPPIPNDPSWNCTKHDQCIATWKQVWWNVIGRSLLHPYRPMPIESTSLILLVDSTQFRGMSASCKKDILESLQADPSSLDVKDGYIDSATKNILSLLNPNRIPFSSVPTPT